MLRVTVLAWLLLAAANAAAAEPVDFAHEVVPILKACCVRCHGNGKAEGELSIDTRESLLAAKAIVPGNPEESELIARVTAEDEDVRMPPEGAPLSAEQIGVLARWVEQGAPWEPGFTFQSEYRRAPLAPRTPDLPPAVDGRSNPVDRIVDAYLTEQDVPRPGRLEDAKFLRRASLDLIGLLPTPDELDRFLDDERADKRARLVEELLARDQQYAEHWLTFWNDLLRNDYAGTGFIDKGRLQITGWLYRSLKENMPYDQFVRGLISPTEASEGFIYGIKWRGRVNASQATEIQFAQNVGQVFLGINLKCASCHDSFIDDWTLKETYGLAAIVSEHPLEIHRCDKPTAEMAEAASPFPELGVIDPQAPKEERLKALADMLSSEANGRLARTIVNRLWERLMGRGIVHPVDVMDNPPWSPDLLDLLAADLVAHDFNLKRTLSLICTSETYSLSSVTLDEALPAADYVFNGPIAKQLTAEQFLDCVWRITRTGPETPNAQVGDRGEEPVRASLVTSDPLMRSLGRPGREQVVTTRPGGLTTLQALDLSNGEILSNMLMGGGEHLQQAYADRPRGELINWLFRATLSRPPTGEERRIATQIVSKSPTPAEISDLLWSLFLLPEFELVQ